MSVPALVVIKVTSQIHGDISATSTYQFSIQPLQLEWLKNSKSNFVPKCLYLKLKRPDLDI